MKFKLILLLSLLLFIGCSKKEKSLSLTHNNVVREYYVSSPENMEIPCPLIIVLHNFYGSAGFIQKASEMDEFALPKNIVVVYPEGIGNSWNIGAHWDENTQDDIAFIDVLIDSVTAQFNIDLNRVYACGYSNGGYMTYELACNLSHKITAFGSIGGNFMLNADQQCEHARPIPIIDFKGTADPFVAYDIPFEGTFSNDGSLLINENIAYWNQYNHFTDTTYQLIEDIHYSDSTKVEIQTYSGNEHGAVFVHYKIINGGHQWFGGKMGDEHLSYIGFNNHDIHASEILIDFFLNYQLSDFIPVGDSNN